MRHRKIRSRLNRTTEHRQAMLRNMAASLIEHEKVRTTSAKAKALRPFVERLVTMGKNGSLAARRRAFAALGKKQAVHKLFTVFGPRFQDRPGGFTRIVRDGLRAGDGATMAVLEFVDREIVIETEEEADRRKTRAQRARETRRAMLKQQRRM
jgi:large subunit ribosomal protein L17